MFRDVKLQPAKKSMGAASAADSLANPERPKKVPKQIVDSEACSINFFEKGLFVKT
jgi:hypothetical protein